MVIYALIVGQIRQLEKGRERMAMENTIGKLLMQVGISPSILGYGYLKTAISIAYENVTEWRKVTKVLYPEVAKHHGTTPSKAERAMRHAIEKAYSKGDIELLNTIILVCDKDKGKPTCSEFIAGFAEYLRMGGDSND